MSPKKKSLKGNSDLSRIVKIAVGILSFLKRIFVRKE